MVDRTLEETRRKTATDPSEDNRTELLQGMIRSARGQILWWPCQESPHPAAARIRFESSFRNEVTHQEGTHSLTGWGVAVPSVADLVELAQTHRQGTLVDLASGRWARVLGTPHGPAVERVAAEALTVDALGRSRSAGEPAGLRVRHARRQEAERLQPWTVPTSWYAGPIAVGPSSQFPQRWQSEPLFDTVVLEGYEVAAFSNYHSFSRTLAAAGQTKAWGVHTNVRASSGGMPQGYSAYVYGVSVELLDERMLPLPTVLAVVAAAEAMLSFELQQTALATVPLPLVVVPDPGRVSEPTLTVPLQGAPIYPLSFPVPLEALTNFQVRLRNHRRWEDPLPGAAVLARVLLHAHVAKGIV